MNMLWSYNFEGASSFFAKQPVNTPTRSLLALYGIDGRYDGVLRRYPGHIRYPDSTGALGSSTGAADFAVDTARAFTINKEPGSDDKITGLMVGNYASGDVELWYRHSTDSAGVLRKKALTEKPRYVGTISGTTASGYRTGLKSQVPHSDGTVHGVDAIASYDAGDGQGALTYFAGWFSVAGGQPAYGIARIRPSGRMEAVGQFSNRVHALHVHGGVLVAGGTFVYVNNKSSIGLAVWNGTDWTPLNQGLAGNGTCYALASYVVNGTNYLFIGGDFSGFVGASTSNNLVAATIVAESSAGTALWKTGLANGSGYNDVIYALLDATNATGCTPGLYFGGAITGYSATTLNHIGYVTYSGTTPTVHAIDDGAGHIGVNDDVRALALHYNTTVGGTVVYAGGEFTAFGSAGGTDPAAHLVYLDGSNDMVAVGTGTTDGDILALTSTGGTTTSELFVGMSGGTQWNGSAYTSQIFKLDQTHAKTNIGGVSYTTVTNEFGDSVTAKVRALTYIGSTMWWGGNVQDTTSRSIFREGSVVWDLAAQGRFLYLTASNGEHRTIYWNPVDDDFEFLVFGVETAENPPPNTAVTDNDDPDEGRLRIGNYQAAYRYFDPVRGRRGHLSLVSADARFTANNGILQVNGPGGLGVAPRTYSKAQTFCTTSSLSTDVAAGGPLYQVIEGTLAAVDNRHVHVIGTVEEGFSQNDNGRATTPLNDDSFSLLPEYSAVDDAVGTVGTVYASAIFQGIHFVVEAESSYMALRWSPEKRVEYENFPANNRLPLAVTTANQLSCRFVQAGDYMYLFAGDRVYRIQRAGQRAAVIEISSDLPLVHRDAVIAVGPMIMAVTENGLLQLNGNQGSGQLSPSLRSLFWNRWRGTCVANDNNSARIAYDSLMGCVYIHNRAISETLCLWIDTGKITMLPYHFVETCVTSPDLDSLDSLRTYFVTRRRWLTSPNWDADDTYPFTMGLDVYSINEESVPYNTNASAIETGSGPYTLTLTFNGHPFSTAGGSGSAFDVTTIAVTFLGGVLAGRTFEVASNTSSTLVLTSATTFGDGDLDESTTVLVALAPVHMAVVGGSLWMPQGYVSLVNRAKTETMTVVVDRISSGDSAAFQQTSPANSTYGLVTYGASRISDITGAEPKTNELAAIVAAHQVSGESPATGQSPLGQALDSDKYSANTGLLRADGTPLLPWFQVLSSNLMFEVLLWQVEGSMESSRIAGPGA